MISAQYIMFDLDGTLIDPKPGITKSIQWALEKMGAPVPPADTLEWRIGPPLHLSFGKLLASADEDTQKQAVQFFAERFETVGKYEARVYPETADALSRIKQLGYKMHLATSKPQAVAQDIIRHFALDRYFDGVYGSLHDKALLVAHILEAEAIDPADTLMVGDREQDILAAKNHSVRSVGVTYGYGSAAELNAASPDYLFDSLLALADSLAQVEPGGDH